MIQSYGRKFVHADSGIALQYYMLASDVRGNSIAGGGERGPCMEVAECVKGQHHSKNECGDASYIFPLRITGLYPFICFAIHSQGADAPRAAD